MASWMTHLRIADKLLDNFNGLSQVHFIVGNIAPDSGELVAGTNNVYIPSGEISHWKLKGIDKSEYAEKFKEKYLVAIAQTDDTAFYLGYYSHLLTDFLWVRDKYSQLKDKYAAEFEKDPGFIWQIRRDLSDLDHFYLKEHPDFRSFAIFSNISYFPNTYLEYFSNTAIENKIAYITNFFKDFNDELDREYPYVTKNEIDMFVDNAVNEICLKLNGLTIN